MMIDLLIRGGEIVDGTGKKGFTADVGVQGDRIVEVGRVSGEDAAKVIEAEGKKVCPGFIDIHSHNDLYVIRDNYKQLFEPYLRQGMTTCVSNNCGWSVAPWPGHQSDLMSATIRSMGIPKDVEHPWETQREFHAYLKERGLPMNFVPLVGHGPIRIAVMGEAARFSTEDELDGMKRLLKEGMEAGCRGFSTGLTYFPGMYAHTDEIVELAKVACEYGGRYATHVRGHSGTYDLAVGEAIDIAARSGCPLQLSHVFAVPYLGRLADVLVGMMGAFEAVNRVIPLPGIPNPVLKNAIRQVDRALDDGIEIGMDFIPYVMGNTTVTQLYPPWVNVGGTDGLLARLRDPAERSKIRKTVETLKPRWPHWEEGSWSDNYVKAIGWKMLRILSVASEKNRSVEGKRVVDLAREAGKDPFDYLADLTIEEDGMLTFLFGTPPRPWSEKVFIRVQDHPQLSIGADVLFPEVGMPPQSAYGTFVRIIEHYVKDLKFYTLEEAVHRSTGLSASRYGLDDRGVIKPGAAADIVVFDFENIHDNSTYDDPEQYPDGIEYVIVNGRTVVEKGTYDPEALAGRLLEK
jgi:N-acyl-D-amino-acid deacylase